MDEPAIARSNPETAIVIPEQSIGLEGLPDASNRIRLGFSVDELPRSAGHSDQRFSLFTLIQIIDLRWRHLIMRWRTGRPSPKPGLCTGPEIACTVLIQRQNHSAQHAGLPVALRTAASNCTELASGSSQ